MNNINKIIEDIETLYNVAGKGKWLTDSDKLKEGYDALVEEINLPYEHSCRIWGIISDVYNKEHIGILSAEPIEYLKNELYDYFKSVNSQFGI